MITHLLTLFSKWENKKFKIFSFFLLSLGAFCQQGNNYKVKLISTRCLFIFLFFTGTLLFNFYASVLVSHLVNMKYESNVNTMSDLIDSDLDVGFLNSSVISFILKVNIYLILEFIRGV